MYLLLWRPVPKGKWLGLPGMIELTNSSPWIENMGEDTKLYVREKQDGMVVLTEDNSAGSTLMGRNIDDSC
jgi:hypothetical protein